MVIHSAMGADFARQNLTSTSDSDVQSRSPHRKSNSGSVREKLCPFDYNHEILHTYSF